MSKVLTRRELLGATPIWLLNIDYAGSTYRFSTEQVDIEGEDGSSYRYDGQLRDVGYSSMLTLFSSTPQSVSLAMDVVFPDDVAQLVARGHDLHLASAELSLWLPGRSYEDRHVVFVGRVEEPEYGEDGEPVTFSLRNNPYEDRSITPPSAAMISINTCNNLDFDIDSDILGRVYPFVFGQPGAYDSANGTIYVPGSPAYLTDPSTNEMLIAGHTCYVTGLALNRYIRLTDPDGNEDTFDLVNATDDLGRKICTVPDVTLDKSGAASAVNYTRGGTYWTTWNGNPGGLQNRKRNGCIEGAGELLEYFLDQTSLTVDRGRFEVLYPALNTYQVAGYYDSAVSPWKWLQDNLLPLLPLSILSGPKGIYPVLWRYDATSADAVVNLEEGFNAHRDGRVLVERSDIFNEIRLEYALDAMANTFKRTLTVKGEDIEDPGNEFTTLHCRVSRLRYGVRAKTLSSNIVYRDKSASKILSWMSRFYAFPRRSIVYNLSHEFATLEPGDVVTLIDAGLHLSNQLAIVESLAFRSSHLGAKLLIIEDPARDQRV